MKKQASKKHTRRVFGPRNPRTYYAMAKDKSALYRFGSHAQRNVIMQSDDLVPISALEYRTMANEDVGRKLSYHDNRSAKPVNIAPSVQPTATQSNVQADVNAQVTATLAEFRSGVVAILDQFRNALVQQPQGGSIERSAPSH